MTELFNFLFDIALVGVGGGIFNPEVFRDLLFQKLITHFFGELETFLSVLQELLFLNLKHPFAQFLKSVSPFEEALAVGHAQEIPLLSTQFHISL